MERGTSARRKGKSTTSKMNSGLASLINMLADKFVINGCTYCRPHLKISCHLCEVDYGLSMTRLTSSEPGWDSGLWAIQR
jgi:hypothetical protein